MKHSVFALSCIALACTTVVNAATPVKLNHQPVSVLQGFASGSALAGQQSSIKELNRHVDFNGTAHVRVQQHYAGSPVWGGDAVIHVPNGKQAVLTSLNEATTMNGIMYQGIATDLKNTPAIALSEAQAEKALQHGVQLHRHKTGIATYDNSKTKKALIVYIDKSNKAHYAYLVSFVSSLANGMPAVPTYILDASNFTVYEAWDDLQTLEDVTGGGFGGNPKMGKLSYDGLDGNYPTLEMQRDAKKKICYLKNADVVVKDDKKVSGPFSDSPDAKFKCAEEDSEHNNLYWSGEEDATNEAYSPANDALYDGRVIKDMYQRWYNVPVLSQFGMPMTLVMHAHAKDMFGQVMDNAYFLSFTKQMYFGDGVKYFYPLTSLGVGAHEISHGFTSEHSNLAYEKQSGGLNESYSDMAAQAAEFYSIHKNSWQIGPEIVKGDGALRYMDEPSKDGKSIGHMKDYTDDLNVHYSSGIFNKVFYLLGTSKGWDTKKAFDVMVKANMDYWTANSTFAEAACGILSATSDYKYDATAVLSALKQVGLDDSQC